MITLEFTVNCEGEVDDSGPSLSISCTAENGVIASLSCTFDNGSRAEDCRE